MALRLVVGLGNPGPEYERTRHNVGFRLADRLAGEADSSWRDFKGLGLAVKRGELWVAKPMTYMNDSGRFVRAFADYHHVAPPQMLIVYDEISLPLGRVRLRPKGSAGGQRGMESVIQHLGTQEIARLRLGIGPQPERVRAEDFVLARFRPAEEEALGFALDLGVQAVETLLESGLDAAMNRVNAEAA